MVEDGICRLLELIRHSPRRSNLELINAGRHVRQRRNTFFLLPPLRRHSVCGKLEVAAVRTTQEPHMSTSLEAIQAEASRLSPTDRSRLLEHLIASLEVDDEVEAAWEAVADEREADLESEKVRPVAFEDAIARLESRFPG